jgi:hypothetical protein
MKRKDAIRAGAQANATVRQMAKTDWIVYLTRVLAFIGLWQVLANGTHLLTLWF